jgi:K+-sensing histidine kinase KdpD
MPWRSQLPMSRPALQRYGLAVLWVGAALGGAIFAEGRHVRDVEVPLFLFAVALTAWYGGPGPAVLGLALSCLSFAYFFSEPLYSFYIQASDLPYFLVFTVFASLVTWFSTVRRRVEQELRVARDELEIEVGRTNPTGQSAESHARHHIRARHERRNHLLESGSPGAVWLDG